MKTELKFIFSVKRKIGYENKENIKTNKPI